MNLRNRQSRVSVFKFKSIIRNSIEIVFDGLSTFKYAR